MARTIIVPSDLYKIAQWPPRADCASDQIRFFSYKSKKFADISM
jgi:hypothetical protein